MVAMQAPPGAHAIIGTSPVSGTDGRLGGHR